MDIKSIVFGVVGGLGLFLFGMGLMSDGLKKVAGQKLRNILQSLTKHRVIAVLVGAFTTCLIQSSSATTVMTVGFVNAGLLSLKQALCVILGANIGTTFTAWIVSAFGSGLKISVYSMPAIGIGVMIKMVCKTERMRSIGQIILGLGMLFIGIDFMEQAFGPLRSSERVHEVLIWLGRNPILAVLAGTAITVLIQSSSASIMIIQVMAFQGLFGTDWHTALQVAIPFILGDNIGTTITAQLAALQTSRNAKRAAMGHTLFNALGVAYMLPIVWLGWYSTAVEYITPFALTQKTIMVHIAVAHSLFNIFNTIVFVPVIGWLEYVVLKIIPVKKDEIEEKPVVLEKRLLNTPVLALDQARREIVRMTQRAKKACLRAMEGLIEDDVKKLEKVRKSEDLLDSFQDEITSYLVALSREQLSDEVSQELPVLLHTVNDLERIGDHAINIVEIAERKIEKKIVFSDSAKEESGLLQKEICEMLDKMIIALENNDKDAARSALVNEDALNRMQMDFRRSHVQRITENVCSPEAGLIFIDLVNNVEKMGDHLTNIAQAIIGGLHWDGIEEKS